MRYGFCTGFATSPLFALSPELIRGIADSGYDYAELPLISLENLGDGDIELLSSWFSAPVMCNLFPGRLSLFSDRTRLLLSDCLSSYGEPFALSGQICFYCCVFLFVAQFLSAFGCLFPSA